MFDIGFIEMLVIGLILLLVVGPERFPEVARMVGGWFHQAKQYLDGMKSELDRDLHLSELQRETRESFEQTRKSVQDVDRETREATDPSRKAEKGSTGGQEAGAEGQKEEPATADEGGGEASAAPAGEGEVPEPEADPEREAAEDMERELEKDQPKGDKDRG
ncbi:Sec-independent protein translocase protein TatB [Thiohalorhabdus denitrificans]|uniref:Sec-independent protein translocase protein TatB n=1 Tax=Thiohalorhabdus denitrificans TaxID=381306 RepID=A0A1G5GE00_9GAMM|nr:Sec-independent protein translocase protein TatB [Thiohalorhabdus denitrificans]SCY49754.1 sec-independent protein translocase protein TatB [Thiohalorhabdus denitrificans]